jgi:hypothetical protein
MIFEHAEMTKRRDISLYWIPFERLTYQLWRCCMSPTRVEDLDSLEMNRALPKMVKD